MQCACGTFSSVACPALQYISTLRHKRSDFRGGKKILNLKYILCFSLQLLSEIFLVLKIIHWDSIIIIYIYIGRHIKCPLFLSYFRENRIFSKNFRIIFIYMKFHENPFNGNRIVPCGIQMDRHDVVNPLNAELNPICYLLALLAHHCLHVGRIRVKSLTLRLIMSYIYGAPILDVSRSHTTTQHSR